MTQLPRIPSYALPPLVFWAVIVAALGWVISSVSTILLPFVLGMMLAYLSDGLCDRMERRMPRAAAAGLVVIAIVGVLVGIVVWLLPLLVEQLGDLLHLLPQVISDAKRQSVRWLSNLPLPAEALPIDEVKAHLGQATGSIATAARGVLGNLLQSGNALLHLITSLLLTPVVAFYCLRDWDKMVARIDALLPRAYAPVIREQIVIIDRTLAAFLRGQLNVCMLMATFYALGLTLVGLEFGFVVGLMSGLLMIVPYAGAAVGASTALLLAISQFHNPMDIGMVAAVYALGQAIEGSFLTPKLVGEGVGLHPLWLIFGMLAGGALLGAVGVVLAVPLTAIIGVLVRFGIARYLESSMYGASPAVGAPPKALAAPTVAQER